MPRYVIGDVPTFFAARFKFFEAIESSCDVPYVTEVDSVIKVGDSPIPRSAVDSTISSGVSGGHKLEELVVIRSPAMVSVLSRTPNPSVSLRVDAHRSLESIVCANTVSNQLEGLVLSIFARGAFESCR